MDPFTIMAIAGAVSAAAGVGGGIMANDAREEQANSANKWGLWMQREQFMHQNEMANFNARQAATARDWSQMMSDTSYRRGMADMRAAGLNPILAYGQGGASAGQAVSASGTAGGGFTPGAKADMQDVVSPAVNSGMNAVRMIQGVQSAQEEIKQTQANTALQQVQAGREAAATGNILQQTATEAQRTGLVSRQAATEAAREGLVQAQTGAAAAQTGLDRARTETEYETRNLRQAQTIRENWQGESARQEAVRFENWGPRSAVTDAAASAEQIAERTRRMMQEGLGPFLRIGR